MKRDNVKRVTPDFDEEKMMELMVDGVRKEGFEMPAEAQVKQPENENLITREQNNTKNNSQADYNEVFFKEVKTTARHGKSVYINPDQHKKLTRIIQVIGDNNITIYAYLSNLLDHHFQEFEGQITSSFNEKYKPIL